MTDPLTKQERSERMARVTARDTKPEMRVRQLVHRLGFRYRLHVKNLPGTPDIVFRPRHKAIYVHGCFWHRHPGCKLTRWPKSKREFWANKFAENVARDKFNQKELERLSWSFLIVWECETLDTEALTDRLVRFLDMDHGGSDVDVG